MLTFNDVSIFRSCGHLVYQSGMILATLVVSHLGNIPQKFEFYWRKIYEEIVFIAKWSCFSILSSGCQFVHRSGTILAFLVWVHLSNIPMKFE